MGADHDKDTACSSQQTHIMWPYLSSNSGRTFSSCSRQSIGATMTANNSCYLDAMDLSLTLDNIDEKSVQITVTNEEYQRTTVDGLITLTGPDLANASSSHNCKPIGSDTLECRMGSLAPMQSQDFSFNFKTMLSDTAQVTATVDGISFVDAIVNNNGFETDIYGNWSSYLPDSSQPTIAFREGISSPKAAPDTAGGMFHPNTALVLAILLLIRNCYLRRAE